MKEKGSDFEIGVDIVYIPRIQRILDSDEKEAFLKRSLSKEEIDEFRRVKRKAEYLSGRFALKESLVKINRGRRGIRFSEISCTSKKGGPSLSFSGKTSLIFKRYEINFSISHDHDYAFVVAIARRLR
ncbi:MAG: holo-ACP synthase [Myxococcota bacterium]